MTTKSYRASFTILTINGALICLFLGFQTDFLCSLTLLVWTNIFIYSIRDIGNRSMLFAFNIAFFTFLLGREFLEQFFDYERESFNREIWFYADLILFISVSTYSVSYLTYKGKNFKKFTIKDVFSSDDSHYVNRIRRLSTLLFWITLSGAIIYAIIFAVFVATVGYMESYSAENNQFLRESLILRILNRCEMILPVALCSFYATMPSKNQCNLISGAYLIYLILTLFGGHRGECVLGLLLLLVYYLYRNKYSTEGPWIKKIFVIIGACSLPLFLILLTAMNDMRKGEEVSFDSITEGLTDFVYQQGVSATVFKRAIENEKALESEHFYSLHFLNENLFAIFDDESYPSGNSPEKAQSKKWMQHTLPYIIWPKTYLLGQGTGSSYIAELNQDFGVFGVILGNILYGFLLAKITFFTRNKTFLTSVKLIIITQLLWAPRGGFTQFISVFMTPSTLMGFAFIFVGGAIMSNRSFKYIFNH